MVRNDHSCQLYLLALDGMGRILDEKTAQTSVEKFPTFICQGNIKTNFRWYCEPDLEIHRCA